MIVLFVAALAVAQVPSAERIEAALKKSAGERKYVLKENGKAVGSLVLRTSVEKDAAVFEDTLEGSVEGAKLTMTTKERAALDGLRLLSMKRTLLQGSLSVIVEGGKAVVEVDGKKSPVDITRGTIGESAVFRLLAAAEQKEGTAFKVDVLAPMEPELQKGWDIRCVAKESIEIAGRKFDTWRWELKWEHKGERDGVPVTSRREETYWLEADGRLLRNTVAGGMEIELEKP